jgi:Dihydrofolate reductase
MIYLVVAFDEQMLIGSKRAKNGIPWHFKEDLQHFKSITLNQTILMGRLTFEAIGKPLPNRKTIVISQGVKNYLYESVIVRIDLLKVIQEYRDSNEDLFIVGGASIYEQALPYVDEMIVSRIPGKYVGEVFFPDFVSEGFKCISEEVKNTFVVERYRRK